MNLIGNINAIPFRRFRGGGGAAPFPNIPGMIARYSALGLTNEQMATNPVWVDKTGNGHDLQMKNFLWGGMSGVGGYKLNWSDSSIWRNYIAQGSGTGEVTDNTIHITSAKTHNALFETRASLKSVEYKVLIKGLTTDDIYLRYDVFNDGKELWTEIKNDGIYTLPSYDYDSMYNMKWKAMSQTYPIDCNITIEQLPLYPGALVFDGVDDYGTCDNFPILTKEKGYTVVALRQYLFNAIGKIWSLVTNASHSIVSRSTLTFELINSNGTKINFSFGRGNLVSDFEPNVFSYMTSKSYNGKTITPGDVTESNKRILVGNFSETAEYGSNVAIWELVFLDHDATEEELTKIKDYFVKTYPWLFPDQAWTVVGKTNEDEDRATIANITGNGNDLILSNLGFAEGSGYNEEGEYAGYLVTDGVDDKVESSVFTFNKDWTIVGNWTMLSNIPSNCGIIKVSSMFLYNSLDGVTIYFSGGPIKIQSKSINAFCSDGRIYLNDWTEILKPDAQIASGGSKSSLNIASYSANFTKMAFKNLAIYDGKNLSKDDCIKAYNYLQTLKAK